MSPDPREKTQVLFIEDAFDQALLVKAFLAPDEGYAVTHVQDGDSAIRLLEARDWDLLVTDLNLPGTDGFAVIRAAKSARPNLPILATTGYTNAQYQEEALRAGANALLTKPLDRAEFMSRVESLAGTRAARRTDEPEMPKIGPVLAISGLAGDAEMGCGGALLQASEAARTVVVVALCADEPSIGDAAIEAAKVSAKLLGAHFVVDKRALRDTSRRVALVEKAIAELRPTVVYLPAMSDTHSARMEAFRIGKAATTSVPVVLGYQTPTTTNEFNPMHFVDVSGEMLLKKEALDAFENTGRTDVSARFAQSLAQYWGRQHRFTDMEAFEIIRGPF